LKENCIVLDVDGVILDTFFIFEEIFELKLKGDDMWDYFHSNCNSEKVKIIKECKGLLALLYILKMKGIPLDIILLTSRNEKVREATEKKLKTCMYYDKLIMRPKDDYRESHILKKEELQKLEEKYNILMYIDDDLKNCEAGKELGIFTLRKV
jgi:predicted secreted acid phosphatase